MRFFTLAFALVGATAISAMPSVPETGVSFTFDAPSINPNSTLEERTGGGGGGEGGGKDHCKKERGRRPDTCGCYSGLDCHDSTSQCECGDQGNAKFDFCGSCKNDEPKCVCKGENQKYDKNKRKCICKPGYNPSYGKHGVLKCVPCPPTPSRGTNNGHKRALETALAARSEALASRDVEVVLGCNDDQKACKVNDDWICFDVQSSLESCGACPGEGLDCASINGVDEVRCHKGQCVIDSCQSGYTVDLAASTCVAGTLFGSTLLVQDQ